jgi:hypothetical protein
MRVNSLAISTEQVTANRRRSYVPIALLQRFRNPKSATQNP